jgi:predicted site-specific integrase-resolvase
MEKMENELELLTVKQAANIAQVHLKTVYVWIYKGILEVNHSKTGFIRIPKVNLLEFLNNKENNNKMAE